MAHDPDPDHLLTVRALVILAVAVLVAAAAGALTYAVDRRIPNALLAAGAAFGATVLLLHKLVQ